MIRNQYLIYIHSFSCNTSNQFSFLQSWDICAAAEPIMLSLLCEDSYAIKYYKKNQAEQARATGPEGSGFSKLGLELRPEDAGRSLEQ